MEDGMKFALQVQHKVSILLRLFAAALLGRPADILLPYGRTFPLLQPPQFALRLVAWGAGRLVT
eukprot:750190-Hanusia_phi.AAC.2